MDKILESLRALSAKIDQFINPTVTDAKAKASDELLLAAKGELATAATAIADRDTTIAKLTADLEKSQAEANAHGLEIKALTDQLAAEQQRTGETLASLGVDPKVIPSAQRDTSGNAKSKRDEYLAMEDSAARTKFYRENKAAIDAAYRL